MGSFKEVKELESKQLNLKVTLTELIKSNATIDQINEINSEIKHLDDEITKLLGKKEKERRKKLREEALSKKNIKNFEALKEKKDKVSSFRRAVSKFLISLEKSNSKSETIEEYNNVKVKV